MIGFQDKVEPGLHIGGLSFVPKITDTENGSWFASYVTTKGSVTCGSIYYIIESQ